MLSAHQPTDLGLLDTVIMDCVDVNFGSSPRPTPIRTLAAVILQSMQRGGAVRRRRQIAIIRLQRAWRASLRRKSTKEYRAHVLLQRHNSATRLQRAYRRRNAARVKDGCIARLIAQNCHLQWRVRQQNKQFELLDWVVCPITQERIEHPALCLTDGRLYEQSAITQALHHDRRSPYTRVLTDSTDIVLLRETKGLLQKPVPQVVWSRIASTIGSSTCDMCDHVFKASKYKTYESFERAKSDHLRDKH